MLRAMLALVKSGDAVEVERGHEPQVELDGAVLRFWGRLRTRASASIWRQLHAATDALTPQSTPSLTVDLSGIEELDGGVTALLTALKADLAARGIDVRLEGTPERIRPLLDLYDINDGKPGAQRYGKRRPSSVVAQVGAAVAHALQEAKAVVAFFGEMVAAIAGLIRRPRSGHWREVPPLIEKAGADALPIVLLLNFLMGFVMAYQSARQLKLYGANLYVADLVSISVTRELAPLMTAIIVCGRNGAAFAAEIGTMKVSEEIDALRTIGLRPFEWLVVPRVLALLFVGPALTILGDIIGVIGGMVVGATSLGISPRGYLTETQVALKAWDVEHGMIKSVAFALAIGLISCQQGFAASGGAEGVGRRTTSTVVTCLFTLVVLDALLTVIFRMLGR